MFLESGLKKIKKQLNTDQILKLRKFQNLQFRGVQNFIFRFLFGSSLRQLALIYGSDKWGKHKYAQHYETFFAPIRRNRINILEIGVG